MLENQAWAVSLTLVPGKENAVLVPARQAYSHCESLGRARPAQRQNAVAFFPLTHPTG